MRRGQARRAVVRVAITAAIMAVAAWGGAVAALADVVWT